MKPWDELTPEERLALVELIAVPGQTWTQRARALYEWLRKREDIMNTADPDLR